MDEIVRLVNAGAGFSAIKAACDAIGGGFAIRVYNGQQRGTTDSVPSKVDTYHTHNHGELTSFTVSTAKPGDIVDYKGMVLRVIVNQTVSGDAHMPSTTWFVAEKVK